MSGQGWSGVLELGEEVAQALEQGTPLVALETAVFSHGLPQPTALAAAEELEQEVRSLGAVPALVAVVDGKLVVGAPWGVVRTLLDPGVWKVAERDLPVAVARGATGGTTVSATVAAAHRVGIPVVATGGIGGVHVGGSHSWDVSSDLRALAQHPVAVVSSGVKAVCDPALTLEYLDTAGATVVGYRTDRFPYFYAQESGLPVPHRVDSPEEVAAVLRAKLSLGQATGLLVANPVPAEAALSLEEVQRAVRAAVARAAARGVWGADLTPYLLAVLQDLTGGRSLAANTALLRSNARLAAQVAVAYAKARPRPSPSP